jgi:hypothetical protein
MYAGTLSLQHELKAVDYQKIEIGDIIVQGGSPGHAVMVVDLVQKASGEKLIMLAQSYKPAQEIHIIKNPHDGSVWHALPSDDTFLTAEWTFENYKIGRF